MKINNYTFKAIICIVFLIFELEGGLGSCICGLAKRGEKKKTYHHKVKRHAQNRIVNGYEPSSRPWMVFLNIEGSGICGATILNKYWIISAAHCFCAINPCIFRPSTRINFNTSIVTAFLGQHDISRRFYNKKNIFNIEKIIIYPTYTPSNHFHDDLALLKVNRIIRFNKYRMPICLPDTKTRDTKIHAYVSGWGLLQGRNCTTNDEGPVRHQPCSLPFMWKGIKISKCVHTLTPSSENPNCKAYKLSQKHNRVHYNSKEFSAIRLIDEDDKEMSNCYSESPKDYGWCATCINSAKEGEPGYCGPITRTKRKDKRKNYGKPTFDKNWGWCSENCVRRKTRNDRTNILQETRLYVMSNRLCKKAGKAMKVNTKDEICAGKKKQFKGFKSYKKTSKGFIRLENRSKVPSKFYFGGSDSCTGDSGGPLYTWQENLAVILGVVSRGYGCALYNQAGVYGRLSQKIKWIKKHIKDGDCTEAEKQKSLRRYDAIHRRRKRRRRQ